MVDKNSFWEKTKLTCIVILSFSLESTILCLFEQGMFNFGVEAAYLEMKERPTARR